MYEELLKRPGTEPELTQAAACSRLHRPQREKFGRRVLLEHPEALRENYAKPGSDVDLAAALT
jgi:hypothetical protein